MVYVFLANGFEAVSYTHLLPESLYSGLIEAVHNCLPAHYRYLALRRKGRSIPGIKKGFIRSGIRFD